MGIEELWEVLKEKQCGKTVPLSQLRNFIKVDKSARIAIDAYLLYYKYFCVEWRVSVEGGSFSIDRIFANTIRRIDEMCRKLNNNGLEHVFCLDGDRSVTKLATERRNSVKEVKIGEIAKIHYDCVKWCENNQLSPERNYLDVLKRYDFLREYWPNAPRWRRTTLLDDPIDPEANKNPIIAPPLDSEVFDILTEMSRLKGVLSKYPIVPRDMSLIIQDGLRQCGHRFLSIPTVSEGEKVASIAVKIGFCQAVLSTDSDLLPMGTRMIIKEIKDDIATIYSYPETLGKLQMTHEQLMSLSIMLGNDFNDGIPGMAKVKCLQEVMRPGFNIYDFDLSRGGCLNVNICIEAFTISEQECNLVEEEIIRLFSADRPLDQKSP